MVGIKEQNMQSEIWEEEYVESLLSILDRELAAAMAIPKPENSPQEMDLLVTDLLGYLTVDPQNQLKIKN
jgi:hypothetical protein